MLIYNDFALQEKEVQSKEAFVGVFSFDDFLKMRRRSRSARIPINGIMLGIE